MAARAQQHGGVRFCRAPRQPEQNSTVGLLSQGAPRGPWASLALPVALGGWVLFCRALCQPRPALRGAMRAWDPEPLLGLSGRGPRRVARAPTRAQVQQRAGGLFCRAHCFEFFFIG